MKIQDGINLLTIEDRSQRTPKGRPMSEFAQETVRAAIDDTKNYHMDLVGCLGCGFIVSSLLVSEGCPNCGVIDMTMNIEELL